MIEIRSLVKSFDGFRALDGLNLTVPDGAVYGLCGSNGAGKSTAIRHLAGILRQDSGEVLVGGKEVFENCRKNNIPTALHAQKKINTVTDMLLKAGIYQTLKEVLALYGITSCGCRKPFAETTNEQKAAARRIFDTITQLNNL